MCPSKPSLSNPSPSVKPTTFDVFQPHDTFLIADCHLDGSRPGVNELAIEFINAIEGAGALWVLGDFVEYWLGDDAGNPALDAVFDALAARQAAGTNVHFMHGNRDFLLGQAFAQRLGAQVHADDEIQIPLSDETVVLMHGDTVCTDDVEYQKLRQLLRSTQWQQPFLAQSIAERIETAKSLREKSRDATAGKSQSIMDVNDAAVLETFERTGVKTLIHGHTHRPDEHTHIVDDTACRRIVLGDWHDDHAMVVHSSPQGLQLKRFPFATDV